MHTLRTLSGWLALVGVVGVLCGISGAQEPSSSVNLLANPSFEETAGGGKDEALVPGYRVKFRGKDTEPGLDSAELAVIDDPAQSHSGRRCVRLSPQRRVVGLEYPGEPSRSLSPGLYEMSAWVRGRPGTRGLFGSYQLGPDRSGGPGAAHFSLTSDRWRKVRITAWLKESRPYQPGNIVHVWPEGEQGQPKDPLVFFDDASIVRLSSGLADVFGDHMVLQRDKKLPVWGWTENPGQKVTVKLVGQTRTATSGPDGLDVSPRGDPAGFVVVEDEKTVEIAQEQPFSW